MEIVELVIIGLILYAVGAVFFSILLVAGEDYDKFDATEIAIAWPIILIGLFIKTVVKVFKDVKE